MATEGGREGEREGGRDGRHLVRVEGLLPGAHGEAVIDGEHDDVVHALALEVSCLGDVTGDVGVLGRKQKKDREKRKR